MSISVPSLAISLLPVAALLGGLVYMDSFRLVKLPSVLLAILAGVAVALLALLLNREILRLTGMDLQTYSRYVAPALEETLKALYLLALIFRGRIGFMVDAAIYGFAIGTGFSLVENLAYMQTITSTNLLLWAVRGFGTALMHAGTTAMVGVLGQGNPVPDTPEDCHLHRGRTCAGNCDPLSVQSLLSLACALGGGNARGSSAGDVRCLSPKRTAHA